MGVSVTGLGITSCLIRGTDLQQGRTSWLGPGRFPVEHLHYGRIILEPFGEPVQFANPGQETGLVCLKGRAIVKTEGERFALGLYDAVYIPRGAEIWVTPDGPNGCDLAEFSAPVDNCYPLQLVRFEDVRADPGLHFRPGDAGCKRDLNILIGKNVQAGRIVAGVTFSEPGNWTSWPPHEHAELLEEAYVFIAMPPPAWGIQLVYTDPQSPEVAVAVREGDCVVMPRGYHPNVSTPGTSINFLWMMAARCEGEDRQFGVVNVQPEYANNGSGLEAGRG